VLKSQDKQEINEQQQVGIIEDSNQTVISGQLSIYDLKKDLENSTER
jgi:hypothetical protein